MHICMIGTGYVGLVTGTCFADLGNDVTCMDIDAEKIEKLDNGTIPIYEPGLDVLVAKNVKEGRLKFTTDLKSAVEDALVIFIAVGTPPMEDGSADMRYVEGVAKDIARHMNGYKVIVNKSTVPVGAALRIKKIVKENMPRPLHFSVASNPEFLREGSAIEDFMRPDRVVIGTEDSEAQAIMKDLYSPLYLIETPIVLTDLASAELTKYASNAFLATKISFINEMAQICERVGADVHDVARGMGFDDRIGRKFLHPGPGYGGSCFPKDTRALVAIAEKHDYNFKIVNSTIQVNEDVRALMLQKIRNTLGDLKDKKIAVLGLAFKPNTDDMRDAPSVDIIRGMQKDGAKIRAFDPVATEQAKLYLPDIDYVSETYEAAKDADALVFITEWNQFRSLDLDKLKKVMRKPVIIDLRNIYEPEKMLEKGFTYVCVGRRGV